MIPVSSLHYGVLQQANHTDSEYLAEILAPQRDFYINRAKNGVLEWLIAQDETNDTVRRYLSELVKRDVKLSYTRNSNIYIAKYPEDFYKQKALYAIGTLTGCELEKRIKISRPTSEKFQAAITNTNTKRVWDFKRTYAQEAYDGIHVFSEPDVNLDIYMDYIRKVKDVAYPSGSTEGFYIGDDGAKITEDVDLDLSAHFFKSRIVDLAVLEIKKDYGLVQDYEAQKDFILSIDRI